MCGVWDLICECVPQSRDSPASKLSPLTAVHTPGRRSHLLQDVIQFGPLLQTMAAQMTQVRGDSWVCDQVWGLKPGLQCVPGHTWFPWGLPSANLTCPH